MAAWLTTGQVWTRIMPGTAAVVAGQVVVAAREGASEGKACDSDAAADS